MQNSKLTEVQHHPNHNPVRIHDEIIKQKLQPYYAKKSGCFFLSNGFAPQSVTLNSPRLPVAQPLDSNYLIQELIMINVVVDKLTR